MKFGNYIVQWFEKGCVQYFYVHKPTPKQIYQEHPLSLPKKKKNSQSNRLPILITSYYTQWIIMIIWCCKINFGTSLLKKNVIYNNTLDCQQHNAPYGGFEEPDGLCLKFLLSLLLVWFMRSLDGLDILLYWCLSSL